MSDGELRLGDRPCVCVCVTWELQAESKCLHFTRGCSVASFLHLVGGPFVWRRGLKITTRLSVAFFLQRGKKNNNFEIDFFFSVLFLYLCKSFAIEIV